MSAQLDFANYLKKKRIAAGITQAEVSKKLGYSTPQFVSNWECGRAKPPITTIPKLIKFYGASPDEVSYYYLASSREQLRKAFGLSKSK